MTEPVGLLDVAVSTVETIWLINVDEVGPSSINLLGIIAMGYWWLRDRSIGLILAGEKLKSCHSRM